jgi:hypothetical protein
VRHKMRIDAACCDYRGATRILVTHQTQWLHACDRVLVLRDGAIAADGPWAALRADPALSELAAAVAAAATDGALDVDGPEATDTDAGDDMDGDAIAVGARGTDGGFALTWRFPSSAILATPTQSSTPPDPNSWPSTEVPAQDSARSDRAALAHDASEGSDSHSLHSAGAPPLHGTGAAAALGLGRSAGGDASSSGQDATGHTGAADADKDNKALRVCAAFAAMHKGSSPAAATLVVAISAVVILGSLALSSAQGLTVLC